MRTFLANAFILYQRIRRISMDPIIAVLVGFLMMNLMVVTAMVRRIDVNNASVLEWEHEQALQRTATSDHAISSGSA